MKYTVNWSQAKKFEKDNFSPHGNGVYLIGYRDTETDKRYPVYVGQGDISTRLADHLRNNTYVNKRINKAGRAGYYRYAKVADEDDRLDVELALYHKHGGSKLCNEIEPIGIGPVRQGGSR